MADRLDEEHYGRELVEDARALAWAHLANAYRIASDLRRAKDVVRNAEEHLVMSGSDAHSEARVLSFKASLRNSENVFAIKTPVAIAVVVRYGGAKQVDLARVHYSKIQGTRVEKLAQLDGIRRFADIEWRSCLKEKQAPFLPSGEGDYFSWPASTDLFPWQHSGIQFKRK